MSDRYPGGLITKTPVTPAGPYAEGAAPGVWTLDQAMQYTKQGIWPQASNPTPNDPYFQYVTSLLHGDGTNGGQNNTFLDSSTNAFTITRNGNTTQGSFSPYGSNWGNYFDGSSYFNIASNAAFALPGDFTWEAWVFVTTSGVETIYHGNVTDSLIVKIDSSNRVVVRQFAVADLITTTTTVPTNTWTHIAVSRSSTSLAVWINGVVGGTATNSTSFATSAVYIGADDGGNNKLSGYISNLRLVKGTAVYNPSSSTITVPTTPLTAISGTSLLTCQANRFIDASTNAFTLTINSAPQVTRFSPFAPTYATQYSASTIGGSGYFDGSGDYLTVPSNTAFNLGSGDFTIECWWYPTNFNNDSEILNATGSGGTLRNFSIYSYGSNGTMGYYAGTGGSSWDIVSNLNGGTAIKNAWNHLAFTRSGTTFATFLNGTRVATTTASGTLGLTANLGIGANQSGGGAIPASYISDCRIVKGTALYTASTYTVPTAPLTAVSGTGVLTNFTNGAIYDSSEVADYETVGNAQISTSVKKYGTGSMSFNGSTAKLVAPYDTTMNFGTGNFTIEMWIYFNVALSSQTDNAGLVVYRSASLENTSLNMRCRSAGSISIQLGATDSSFAWTPSTGVWYHLAIARVGSAVKMFVNGTQTGSTSTNSGNVAYESGYVTTIGGNPAGSYFFNGYIDDLRITKGYARYWENFTPPAAALPNFGGAYQVPTQDPQFNYTTLLLPGNGTNGAQNNTFLDSSTNAFTITRNGNTTQGTFTPFSQTGWSNNFNGTNSYFSLPNDSALQLGSGDFTIETWFYRSNSDTTSGVLFDFGWLSSSGWGLYIDDTIQFRIGNSDKLQYPPAGLMNNWVNIAITRSGSTIRMFINGTQVRSNTDSTNLTNTTAYIGKDGTYNNYFNGYLSNTRIVKGTALYTANFTPSTTPLTAVSGTSLLTCQSNRFVDNSTNAFAITVGGSPSVQAFSPFAPTAAYSASTVGGSGYFDGTGDYLSVADNAAFALGTNNFTIDGWFLFSETFEGFRFIVSQSASFDVRISYDRYLRAYVYIGGTDYGVEAATVLKLNEWNHFAFVRNGSTLTIYLNGVSGGTTDIGSSSVDNSSNALTIGSVLTSYLYKGYLSNIRMVNGTALYTGSTYTVPTAPTTAVTNTALLANFTNAGITDATAKNDLETVGNAQVSTAQSKFGGSSLYFDGTGDYLLSPDKQASYFGTGNFTLECWLKTSSTSSYKTVLCPATVYSTSGFYNFIVRLDNTIAFEQGSGSTLVQSTTQVTDGNWHHVAVCRSGTTTRMFVDGVLEGTLNSDTYSYGVNSVGFYVGTYAPSTYNFNGYIQDLRITKGYARYVQPFTPPTQADQLY